MKMVKLSEIPKAARDFTRTFENEKFRLVRSDTQFEKYALAEVEELKELKNGDFAGEKGRRIAYWFADIGYGVICTQANFNKFVKLCESESTSKVEAPVGRGKARKTKAKKETSGNTKKAGRPKKGKTVNTEPDIELDFSKEYSTEKNLAEFTKGFRAIAKHYGIKTDVKSLLSKAPESETITELFKTVAEFLD